MKLLFLLPAVPNPPNAGAKLRNLGLLRLAADLGHEVHGLAFGRTSEAERLDGLCRRAVVVPPPAQRTLPERIAGTVRSSLPDLALRLWSAPFLEALHAMLASERYDAVQAEGLEMARYLRAVLPRDPARDPRPWRVYDAHNAEFLLQRRAWEAALGRADAQRVVQAGYSFVQWRKLLRFEAEVVRTSALTMAVSFHDANQLEALVPSARTVPPVAVVPNGLEVAHYPYAFRPTIAEPSLLFLGKLDYRPNAEAVRRLLREVLPTLWTRVPTARLFVVGAHPPAWLVAAGQRDQRIAVTGEVADERPYLERAAVLVQPLAIGGGSRLKALVAMASGVPVVSTRFGMEGIEAVEGTHYLRANGPEEWASTLERALRDEQARQTLASRARALVEQRYDWPALAPALGQAYDTLGQPARS